MVAVFTLSKHLTTTEFNTALKNLVLGLLSQLQRSVRPLCLASQDSTLLQGWDLGCCFLEAVSFRKIKKKKSYQITGKERREVSRV